MNVGIAIVAISQAFIIKISQSDDSLKTSESASHESSIILNDCWNYKNKVCPSAKIILEYLVEGKRLK